MPLGWIHRTLDLIIFGRVYPEIHKWKDEPFKRLGRNHRRERHGLYWYCRKCNDESSFEDLLPILMQWFEDIRNSDGGDKAEEAMVESAHDHFDYIWDDLSLDERKYWEGFFAWVVLHPEILRKWVGVDVFTGRIKRKLECGREIWEETPEVIHQYKELRKEVERRVGKDSALVQFLFHYGNFDIFGTCVGI